MWTGCAPTGSMTAPCTTPCRSSPTSTTSRAWPMGSAWSRRISSSVGECDADHDTLASIALFQTEESAAVGERLLNDWFRHDWPVFQAVPPELTRGAVLVHEELPRVAAAVTSGPRLERRNWSDRRLNRERRSGGDRRVATAAVSVSATP